jgi:hypothetical protein
VNTFSEWVCIGIVILGRLAQVALLGYAAVLVWRIL